MLREGGAAPSRLGAAMRSLRLGLMGALYLCAKKVESSSFVTIVGLVIRFAQLMSFTLTTEPFSNNYRSTADPIKVASSLTTPRRFLPWLTPVVHVALYFASVAWVAVLLLLTANAMYAFIMNKFSFLLPFKALRLMGQLSTSVLFIPLVSMLLSPFECATSKDAWTRAGYTCNTGGFLAMQVVSVVLVALLFGLCALFALAFYDSNPLSRQLIAKAHGRAEVVFLVVQVLLVLVGSVFNMIINSWVTVAVMIGCGVVYLVSLAFFMPWYRHAMNTANICIAVCFLYSAICTVFLLIPHFDTDAAVMAMVGMPLAVLSGIAISNMRATSIIKTPAVRINNVYEVELKCRYVLHQALWGHPTDRIMAGSGGVSGSSGWQPDAHAPPPPTSSLHAQSWTSTAVRAGATLANAGIPAPLSRRGSGTSFVATASAPHAGATMRSHGGEGARAAYVAGSGGADKPAGSGGLQRSASFAHRAVDRHAQRSAPGAGYGMPGGGAAPPAAAAAGNGMDDYIGDDAESREAAVRSRISPAVLAEVHDIYRAATTRFRQSSILHVFFARLYCHYMGNRHMQMSHLLQAERRKPSLDVSFTVFANRKQAESESSGTGAMSAINRVTFEKYAADARRYVMKASMRQVAFWAELALAPLPDLGRLHHLSSEMNTAIDQAERAFTELFVINPQSLVIMRLYAAFNLLVTCNVEKANVLLAEADRIEDQKSKDHRAEGSGGSLAILQESSLDVNADNTAVLCIGGSLRNLGTIMSVNSSCCKVFGFSKLQLERRSVFTLIPPPLDDHLESELRQYVCTGDGRLVDFTRVVFGVHKNGHLLPLLMCVRETPPDEGVSSFIILLRELRTDDQHILMTEDFTIVGCSAGSLAILDVDPNALRSNEVHMTDFVEDWADLLDDLQSQRSTTMRVDTGAPAHDAEAMGIDVQVPSSRRPTSRNATRTPTQSSRAAHTSSGADFFATDRGADSARPLRTDEAAASEDDRDDDDDARTDMMVEGEEVDDVDADEGVPSARPAASVAAGGRRAASHAWIRAHLQRLDLPSGQVLWVLHWQRLASTDMLSIMKATARRQTTAQSVGTSQPPTAGAAHVHALAASVPSAFHAGELSPLSIPPSQDGPSGIRPARQHAGGGFHYFSPSLTDATRGGRPLRAAGDRSGPVPTVSHRSDPGTPFMRNSPRTPWTPLQPTALPGESLAAATAGAADPLAELVTEDDATRPLRPAAALSPAHSPALRQAGRRRRGSGVATMLEAPVSPSATEGAALKHARRPALKSPAPLSPAARHDHTVRLGSAGGGDGGSVAHRSEFGGDKSQASTGTSATKMLTRLRRAFAQRDQQALLPGLWYLRLVGLLVTLLAVGLSVGIVAATVASFNSYADNVSYVTMGSQRVVSTFSALIAMFDTLHIAKGWEEGSDDDRVNLPAYILGNTSIFLALHRAMYTRAQQLPTAMHQYTKSIVTTVEFDQAGSGYAGTDVVLNLFEAGVSLAKHFGQVAATPFANLSSDFHPDVRYLIVNGMPLGNTHELLQISSDAGYTLSVESAAAVQRTQIIVYGCMIALLAILSCGVFLPILINIERAKDVIILRFLELPAAVKKALHVQSQRRFRTLKSQYITDEDEDDLNSDVDSDEERANTTGIMDQLQDGAGETGSDQGDADVDWMGLMRSLGGTRDSVPSSQRRGGTPQSAARPSAAGGARRQRRSSVSSPSSLPSVAKKGEGYQKSAWSFLSLLAQFVGPLVALALFFSCVFGAALVYLSRTSVLVAVSTSATARATCSREVVVDLFRLLMTHAEHETALIDLDTLKDSRDCVTYWERLLQFGSHEEEERGPSAAATPVVETGSFWLFDQPTNDDIYNLMFANACPYLTTLAAGRFDTARCEAFGGGILKQGLAATVAEFSRRATVIGDRRVRTKLIVNDTQMNGFIVPTASYNYTADQQCTYGWCTRPEFTFETDHPLPRPRLPPEGFVGDVPADWPNAPPGVTPFNIADEFSSADMEFIREADAFYVTPALFDLAAKYSAIASDTIVSCQRFLVIFVGVFASSFVLYMMMWPSQIRRTHMDILAKRAIILFIDPEVVQHVRSIRKLVQQILAADTDAVIVDNRSHRSPGGGSIARVAPSDSDNASAAQRMSDGGALSHARSFHGADNMSPSDRA